MDNQDLFSFKNQRKNNLDNKKKYYKPNNKHNPYKNDNPRSNSLVDVYLDTKKYFQMKNIIAKEPTLYDITTLQIDKLLAQKKTYNTKYIVKNQDTLDMALDFIAEGYVKPLVLNLASQMKLGGGVASGKTAQEECLFRRTNAYMTHPENWYPLETNEVIYSPELTIIKNSNYEMLPDNIIEKADISMLAVAAVRKPHLVDGKYNDEDKIIMMRKIESIFKSAILHGHTEIVGGALGCGIFKNPPDQVAEIFKECTEKYGKYFKIVGFAILCVKESDNENLKEFIKKYL